MKTTVSKPVNAFTSVAPDFFLGEVSFIYHEGRALFHVSTHGVVVHENGIPVYLHRDFSEKFNKTLYPEAKYLADGWLYPSKSSRAMFFMPFDIISEIKPTVILVNGQFTAPKKDHPLFKVDQENNIIHRDSEKGLIVFINPKFKFSFITGRTYEVEGIVTVCSGKYVGNFEPTSVKEVSLKTGETPKTLLEKYSNIQKNISAHSIDSLLDEAFKLNIAPLWSLVISEVNSRGVSMSQETIQKALTKNMSTHDKAKLYKMLIKVEKQVAA